MKQVYFNYQVLVILNGENPALLKLYVWMAHDLAHNPRSSVVKATEQYIRECTSIESTHGRKANIPSRATCRHMVGRLVKLGCIRKQSNNNYSLPYENTQEGVNHD